MDAEDITLKNINDIDSKDSINDSDNLIVGNAGTNTFRRFSLSTLLDAIKSRLTSWTFSGFNTSSKTITGAVNEVRSTANGRLQASDFSIQSFDISSISCDSGGAVGIDVDMTLSGYRLLDAWVRTVGYARLTPVACYVHSTDQYAHIEFFVPSSESAVTRSTATIQGLFVKSS